MKYIVEIAKEYEEYFKGILICGIAEGKFAVDVIAREDLEELTSDYINEHFGDLQDTAYQRGINDGSLDVKQRVEGAYQRGLDDAWEAAKKIFGYEIDGGIPIDEIGKVFGYAEDATFCTADIIRHNTASEAIAKLKAYEEQKEDEIKVGDEMRQVYESGAETGVRCVVTAIDGDCMSGFSQYGRATVCSSQVNRWWKKTGRHFDIDKILEEMRS